MEGCQIRICVDYCKNTFVDAIAFFKKVYQKKIREISLLYQFAHFAHFDDFLNNLQILVSIFLINILA